MLKLVRAVSFAIVLAVAAPAAQAQTFPIKMANHNKGYFKGFTSVVLPSYNFTVITANQATAVGGGAASRLNKVLFGVDEAAMRKMADEAHADLRAQFTAAGIPVAGDEASQDALKASGVALQPGNLDLVKATGGITVNQSLRQSYATVGATAAPMLGAFKSVLGGGPGAAAAAKAAETVAKGQPDGAMVVIPTLVVDFAAMQAGVQSNSRRTSATTSGGAAFTIRGVASGMFFAKVYNRGKSVFPFYARPEGDYGSAAPFADDVAGGATVAPTSAFGDNAARGDAVVVNLAAWEGLVRDAYKSYNATLVKAALAGK
ncbi:hypothetical protein [uncultured Phenylobacterium sp.]|uniref:hypothetical protein n=1 Tax=uncultured Phenylobacterium sp. TaxID=349273 RepID=UPI0025CD6C55|nr:hypothetical protein [uncultured Phenylobacterium sp.]